MANSNNIRASDYGFPDRDMWWSTKPIVMFGVWGCAFSVERLHVKESLRPDNAHTPVHRQGSNLVLPRLLSRGASND
jgi:hypothetical protein